MITLTESAISKLKEILSEESSEMRLRVFVQGGGCAGLMQGFSLDETVNEDDFKFKFDGVEVLVDPISAEYLQGSTIDFRDDLIGSNFIIDNPKANSSQSCSCGNSFSL